MVEFVPQNKIYSQWDHTNLLTGGIGFLLYFLRNDIDNKVWNV